MRNMLPSLRHFRRMWILRLLIIVCIFLFFILNLSIYSVSKLQWPCSNDTRKPSNLCPLSSNSIPAILSNDWSQEVADDQLCTPESHIYFHKMHKAASSTVQRLFLRYGYKHNLSFVLPAKSVPVLSYPRAALNVSRDVLFWEEAPFDIMCHHEIYNRSITQQMLGPSYKSITILRNPAQVFESFYGYFGLDDRNLNMTYPKFLGILTSGDQVRLKETIKKMRVWFPWRNPFLFELGHLPSLAFQDALKPVHQNYAYIDSAIRQVEKDFDLVLIAEYMDESLILLRDLLCWSTKDMVAFTTNARWKKQPLSNDVVSTTNKWNNADYRLYKYFVDVFKYKVSEYGEQKMKSEVSKLQTLRQKVREECVLEAKNGKITVMKVKKSARNNMDCFLLAWSETEFTWRIKHKQYPKLLLEPLRGVPDTYQQAANHTAN